MSASERFDVFRNLVCVIPVAGDTTSTEHTSAFSVWNKETCNMMIPPNTLSVLKVSVCGYRY